MYGKEEHAARWNISTLFYPVSRFLALHCFGKYSTLCCAVFYHTTSSPTTLHLYGAFLFLGALTITFLMAPHTHFSSIYVLLFYPQVSLQRDSESSICDDCFNHPVCRTQIHVSWFSQAGQSKILDLNFCLVS